MTLKPNSEEIPDNKELSMLDIKALKSFYAAPLLLAPSKIFSIIRFSKGQPRLEFWLIYGTKIFWKFENFTPTGPLLKIGGQNFFFKIFCLNYQKVTYNIFLPF